MVDKLKEIERTAEIIPTSQKIDKLIKRIEEGDVRIPAFQRGYVWKQNQVIELLESIINNFPIGSILLWNSLEKLKYTRNIAGYKIPDRSMQYPVNYVLDGQQRISSIYAVFSTETEQENATKKYNADLDIFEIFYDLENNKFIPKSEVIDGKSSIVCLRNLLDPLKLYDEFEKLDKKYYKAAKELSSKFLNYEVPVITITNRKKEDVGVIFERINNTGTKLSTLDLMTAWTWTNDFHLLEKVDQLLEELDEKGFGKIDAKLILQTAAGIIKNSTITADILGLTGEEIRNNWDNICEAMRKTVDFLATEIKCENMDFLPFPQQIVSVAKFFSINGKKIEGKQIEYLKKWFWKISFSNRYSKGRTTEKMNHDIENIIEIRNNQFSGIEKIKYTVTEQELITTNFSKGNPLTRAFLLLMAQNNPTDLIKNVKIDIGKSLSKYNRKEYHHVFPDAFLKKMGKSKEKIFSIVNFIFLPSSSNKEISDRSPADYFKNKVNQENFVEILESNILPISREIYNENNYEEFINKRASLIIQSIDKIIR